jgi:hypothetical protein
VKFCLVKDDRQPAFRVGFRGSGFRSLSAKLFFAPERLKKMNIERPTRHRRASTCPPSVDRMLNERQKQDQGFLLDFKVT